MSVAVEEWTVVVVGAGPAGAAVAARLSSRGHRTLLLDRAEFPRRKPCGDCVSPAAVQALERLGALDRVLAAPHAELRGWRIHAGDDAPFQGLFSDGARGVGLARELLDAALLEHARAAGAEVLLGVKVTDVLRSAGRATGVLAVRDGETVELRAKVVIGADGLRSVVSRRLGLMGRRPRLRKVALTARVRGIGRGEGIGELRAESWGCIGAAPIGDGWSNVTVVVSGAEVRELAGRRDGYFDAVVSATPGLAGGRRGGRVLAVGPFDFPVRSAVHDGAMLVGDAAGYYDPFTGQGIYRALRGAELAAAAADRAIRESDVSAEGLRGYDRARRREFGPGERLQHAIEAVVSKPWLFSVAAAALRRRPSLADTLIAVTGDLAPVGALARPRLFLA